MKFLSSALFLALPILSLAQNAAITYPAAGATFTPGEPFTVTISEADPTPGSTGVAVAIGLQSCEEAPTNCPSSQDVFGSVLASGPWTPSKTPPILQNFSVSIPSSFPAGPAKLNLAYFALIEDKPTLQLTDVALNIW